MTTFRSRPPRTYYNENDTHAAQWLRSLINPGVIPPGVVDERSVVDVLPSDLIGFTQCHFFAGVGGWPYALALAGWDRRVPCWTGSCPCQPFSKTGRGAGFADQRHLWPAWQHLIAQCRPPIVFGEQVATRAAADWFDLVLDDLEGMDYAVAAVAFPAAGVGAPHIRDRAYWMGHANGARLERLSRHDSPARRQRPTRPNAATSVPVRMAEHREPGEVNGHWRTADWLACRDGKWRAVERGTFPLAPRLPGRVGRLRGYGNAIVPQAAATFVRASIDTSGIACDGERTA